MERRLDLLKIAVLVFTIVYGSISIFLFAKNLASWPDYSSHAHTIWVVSERHLIRDPFISGGESVVLSYGAPVMLLGALLYPLTGLYTVAVLLAAGAVVFWYFSKRVFRLFVSERNANLSAIIALMNPFSIYLFLTAKMPFIWGTCFALTSLYAYFRGRWILAAFLGVLAAITHPIAFFLLIVPLLLKSDLRSWIRPKDWVRDLKRWLQPYLVPLISVAAMVSLFFQPGMTSEAHLSIYFLGFALSMAFLLDKKYWPICTAGILILAVSVVGVVFELPISPIYYDRIGFFLLLGLMPFLVKKLSFVVVPIFLILSVAAVTVHAPIPDDPEVYRNLPAEKVEALREGYVRYASDGSALYELPKLGIKFSNAGRESSEVVPDAATYAQQIEERNVTYILVYECWLSSPEEKVIKQLGYELFYESGDNRLRIYKTSGPGGI